MVDLRKGDGWSNGGGGRLPGPGTPGGPVIVVVIVMLGLLAWVSSLFLGDKPEAQAAPASAPVAAAPAPAKVAPAVPANGTWTRLAWYWKYDPRKEDRYLTRVVDQYGCAWWMEIGARVSGYKYRTLSSYRHRALRADGIPDCPKSEMPDPEVAYLTDAEMREADIDEMTVVSRTTVKARDPGLVAYYRERRDEAARRTASPY